MSTDMRTGERTSGSADRHTAAPFLIESHDGAALVPALHVIVDPDALPAERGRMRELAVEPRPQTADAELDVLIDVLRDVGTAVPVLDALAARFDLRAGEVSIVAHGVTVSVAEIASPTQLWRRLVSSDGMIVVALDARPGASPNGGDRDPGVRTILAARLPVQLG